MHVLCLSELYLVNALRYYVVDGDAHEILPGDNVVVFNHNGSQEVSVCLFIHA